jgi:hypothetical protein
VASSTAKSVEAFVPSIARTLEASVKRPAVIMLTDRENVTWHPVMTKLSDDLKKRIAALSEKSKNRIYFGGQDKSPTAGAVAWIPFRSQHCRGGIYVACRRRRSALAEKEMEFLTILGTIAGGALDQIQSRRIETAQTAVEVNSFCGIVGGSQAIREVYSQIQSSATSSATVLIEGESGTGKGTGGQSDPSNKSPCKGAFRRRGLWSDSGSADRERTVWFEKGFIHRGCRRPAGDL